MPYQAPCDAGISSSWQDHKDREPPSGEPGTDYACGYGTPIEAAEAGTIVDLSHSNGGGTGRFVTIDLDDGRRVRYLHLSEIWVGLGQRVGRGQAVAASGASGFGSDWGYGAHVHVTLFPQHAYEFGSTLDFQTYVGEDDDMNAEQDNRLRNIENMLQIPGAGYGRPEVIQQRTDTIIGKLETGEGYDWLPAINNNVWALWTPVAVSVVLSLVAAVALLGSRRSG